MKHNKHWLAAALAAALFAGLLTGCGGSSTAVTSSAAVQEMAGAAMEDAANGTGTGTGVTDLDSGALTPQDSRKIIYNATLWLETKQYDQASADLLEAASQAGAYVQSSESSGSAERGDRSVYYTLRVPAEHYSEFLNAAGQAANTQGLPSVMVSHLFIAGGKVSEGEREIDLGGARAVPLTLLPKTDYVALGHLHRRQHFKNNVRYSGSILQYAFDEFKAMQAVY